MEEINNNIDDEDIQNIILNPNLIWSDEQIEIIKKSYNNNIICDSVAGSGKTTTILGIIKAYPEQKNLVLTYNARLKTDSRNKLEKYNLTNAEAESFHSFCHNYIHKSIHDETTINKYFKLHSLKDIKLNLDFDRIIIDEVQDMIPLYYEIVLKIIQSHKTPPLIFLIGDIYQSIYGYQLADERYLKYGDILFNVNKNNWEKLNLSTSYRLTDTIADLLNNQFNMNRNIKTIKKSDFKPRYLICNSYIENKFDKNKFDNLDLTLFNEVKYYLNLGYEPKDIFIISNSLKPKSPICELLNLLKKEEIPFYKATDKETINKDTGKDKILCLTYHKSKGLERKVSIVYGCDSYFFELNKNYINTICPNELYVALTRSTERLTLIQHNTKSPLPFLNLSTLDEYVDIIGYAKNKKNDDSHIRNINTFELTDYTPNLIINKCLDLIKYDEIKIKSRNPINILNDNDLKKDENINKLKNITEKVHNIIHDSLNYYFYYKKYNQNFLIDMIINAKNKKLSYFNKLTFENSKDFLYVKYCENNNNLSFCEFIKLYYIFYYVNNNEMEYKNEDSYNYNYNYKFDIKKAFNNLNKIFIDDIDKIHLSDRKLLMQKKITNQ